MGFYDTQIDVHYEKINLDIYASERSSQVYVSITVNLVPGDMENVDVYVIENIIEEKNILMSQLLYIYLMRKKYPFIFWFRLYL